jgi:hypothetical protein
MITSDPTVPDPVVIVGSRRWEYHELPVLDQRVLRALLDLLGDRDLPDQVTTQQLLSRCERRRVSAFGYRLHGRHKKLRAPAQVHWWGGRQRIMRVAYSRGVFRLREQFISDQAAQAAYDVVTNNCGAPVHARNPCAFHFTRWNGRAPTEFRFQGDLGFGGKLYLSRARGFYVDTYPEDRTQSRAAAIEAANAELASINTRFPWYSVEAVPGRLG